MLNDVQITTFTLPLCLYSTAPPTWGGSTLLLSKRFKALYNSVAWAPTVVTTVSKRLEAL